MRGEIAEGAALRPPVQEIRAGDVLEAAADSWRSQIDVHKLMRVREGQRLPQLRVDHAERRCRHGHPHGQGQAGGRGEGRLPSQSAGAVFHVAPRALDRAADPHGARVLTRERDVAHRAPAAGGGFGRRQAVLLERRLRPGAVVLEFGREIGGVPPGAEPEGGAANEARESRHPSHRQTMGRMDRFAPDVNSHRLAMGEAWRVNLGGGGS